MFDENETGRRVKWIDNPEKFGESLFTFDGKQVYNLFRDYPYALTREQKAIFDEEEPYWAKFFKYRSDGDQ